MGKKRKIVKKKSLALQVGEISMKKKINKKRNKCEKEVKMSWERKKDVKKK
jgi:hypothetical protein